MIAIEKTLTYLAMPCGLIWLGLIVLTVLAWRRKQRGMLVSLSVLLVFYTLAGNSELSKLLIARLEHDYVRINPLEQGPYDAVIVLGGGTSTATNGLPQLSASGDRVSMGLRLFHSGRTQCLITTGQEFAGESSGSADQTCQIWQESGVPEDRIVLLPGRNTREEMAALRQLVDRHPEWKKLGAVTSAWHMRRAMRLSNQNSLCLEPLPADFLGIEVRWEPWLLAIPNGNGFLYNQLACKEILAGLLGK